MVPIPSTQYPVPSTPRLRSLAAAPVLLAVALSACGGHRAWTRVRHGALLLLGLGGCSSSGPSEPVIFDLISIRGEPLPAASDRFFVKLDDSTFETRELVVLAGTVTLLSDKTWQQELEMVRKITPEDSTGQPINEGKVVEDFGRFVAQFGTYRWKGDTLLALIKGPILPGAIPGCCPPGGFFTFRPVPGSPTQFWSIQANDWTYVYERVGAAPP